MRHSLASDGGDVRTPEIDDVGLRLLELRKIAGRRFVRIVMLIYFSAMGAVVAAPAYQDAGSEMEALTMAAIEAGRTEHLRKTCSEEIPGLKPDFGKAALLWRIANETEIQAVMSYRNQPVPERAFDASVTAGIAASSAMTDSLSADMRKKACLGFLTLAKEQNQRMRERTPRVSSYAAAYLTRNRLSELAREEYDFTMGCAKRSADREIDYEKATLVCRCQWTSFSETLTEPERAKFYKLANDRNALLNWPAARRAVDSMAACQRQYLG